MSTSSISSPAQGSSAKNPRVPSCILCQTRKVKCDRKEPCSGCVKAGVQCIPSVPVSIRRRRRNIDEGQLTARLRRCEELLKAYDGNASQSIIAAQSNTIQPAVQDRTPVSESPPNHQASGQEQIFRQARQESEAGTMIVEHGNPRFVDNNLWTSLSEEFRDLKQMLESPPQNSDDSLSSIYESPTDVSTLLLGTHSPNVPLSIIHPPPVQIFRLWQTFLDNVNPLSKILHAPTWQNRVLEASENTEAIPRTTEVVLFAIYTAAVASLSNEECETLMGDSKSTLLDRYSAATKQGLIEIGFMRTSDLVILQAFILFLLARRQEHDPHELWVLSGVAIRIAQRLGVHRDGKSLGLPPFEIEIRRRLWWQIVLLDNRNAQLSGANTSSVASDWDTKIPSNFNDADLFPGMVELPLEHTGQTEMTFCLVICEIAKFFKDLSSNSSSWQGGQSTTIGAGSGWQSSQSNWGNIDPIASASWQNQTPTQSTNNNSHNSSSTYQPNSARGSWQGFSSHVAGPMSFKDNFISNLENHIETKFLRYCDPSIPLHQISIAVARSMIATLKLKWKHPRQRPDKGAGMRQEEKDFLFELSMKIIEYDIQGHKLPSIKRFVWHINVYFQLETFVFMLSELDHRPIGLLSDKAWEYVEEIYKLHQELLTDDSNSLYLAVRNLTLRVWRGRETEFLQQYHKLPDTPDFISFLRSRRLPPEPSTTLNSYDRDGQVHESLPLFEAQNDIDIQAGAMSYHDMTPVYDHAGQLEDSTVSMNDMDWDYWNELLTSQDGGYANGIGGHQSFS